MPVLFVCNYFWQSVGCDIVLFSITEINLNNVKFCIINSNMVCHFHKPVEKHEVQQNSKVKINERMK